MRQSPLEQGLLHGQLWLLPTLRTTLSKHNITETSAAVPPSVLLRTSNVRVAAVRSAVDFLVNCDIVSAFSSNLIILGRTVGSHHRYLFECCRDQCPFERHDTRFIVQCSCTLGARNQQQQTSPTAVSTPILQKVNTVTQPCKDKS